LPIFSLYATLGEIVFEERAMIFYYSRTDKTKATAQALHDITGLPLYPLASDINDVKGFLFAFRAIKSAFGAKGLPVTNMPDAVPEEIYLCAPVWAGDPAGPVKYFIANANLRRTRVHVILTAMTPTHQNRANIKKLLERAGAAVGEILQIATTKQPPEPEILHEHITEWLIPISENGAGKLARILPQDKEALTKRASGTQEDADAGLRQKAARLSTPFPEIGINHPEAQDTPTD